MKTLFLIGDSIRLGYCEYVRAILRDEVQTLWPEENCRFTQHTLRFLHEWAGKLPNPSEVDIVNWNNGLWDACHHISDGMPLTLFSHYENNLHRIIYQIRSLFPRAEIIFALTTPVSEKFPKIQNAEVEHFNQIAKNVMDNERVTINDLYSLVKASPNYICDDGIHLTDEGYRSIAHAVSDCIRQHIR